MKFYLLPLPIAENALHTLPDELGREALRLQYYMVENLRTARRFLKKLDREKDLDSCLFFVLDKRTQAHEVREFIKELPADAQIGIMSEAGCPGIADPGNLAIRYAHKNGHEVIPFTGPSSMFLALMASGFNGQSFAFSGYLPVKVPERKKRIKELERRSVSQTQLFMEAPYRNNRFLEQILNDLNPDTDLCIACNLTAPEGFVQTKKVKEWKKQKPDLHKKPTVFLLGKS